MRTKSNRWVETVVASAFLGVFAASVCGGSDGQSALARLEKTTTATLEQSPILRAVIEDLGADQAAAASDRGAGTPWIQYTREGIGPSFSQRPNAQDILSVGIPFNGPGQGSRAKQLAESADLRTVAMQRVAILGVAEFVGEEWIRIAALADRLEVVNIRLLHLDNALKLQNKRLELGEVAGTEVMQLELARASEASAKASLEAESESCRRRLEAMCSEDCAFPGSGDLAAIQQVIAPIEDDFPAAVVDEAPAIRGAMSDQAVAEARARFTAATIWGRPALGVEWEHFPSVDGLEGFDAMGLNLSVPLPFGRSGKRQIEEADARSRAAAARTEAEALKIKADFQSALSELRGAKARLAALNTVLSELERTEFSLGEQFRLGAVSYLVYIDGLSRLDGIRLEAVDAREQLLTSRLRLAVLIDDAALFPLPPRAADSNEEK